MNRYFCRLYQEYLGQAAVETSGQVYESVYEPMYEFIYEMAQRLKCEYSSGLGFLCTHAFCHNRDEHHREKVVFDFMDKFGPVLKNSQSQQSSYIKGSLSQQTLQRILQYMDNQEEGPRRVDIH